MRNIASSISFGVGLAITAVAGGIAIVASAFEPSPFMSESTAYQVVAFVGVLWMLLASVAYWVALERAGLRAEALTSFLFGIFYAIVSAAVVFAARPILAAIGDWFGIPLFFGILVVLAFVSAKAAGRVMGTGH